MHDLLLQDRVGRQAGGVGVALRARRNRATLACAEAARETVRAGERALMTEVVRLLRKEHTDMAILLDLLEPHLLAGATKCVPLLPTSAILFSVFNNLSSVRPEFR